MLMFNIFKLIRRIGTFGAWRMLVNFWTFIFFVAIVYDFYNENFLADNEILLAIAGIYGAALAIYSAEKEFRRWHHMHTSIHPGELYLIVWTVLILYIIVANVITHPPYRMPIEVSGSYIAVISILAITRESKNFYKKKRQTK